MAADASAADRDYYELRQYLLETEAQRSLLDAYLRDAAIPALNRIGVQPVGVFVPREGGPGPVYVLLRHASPEAVATLEERLLADEDYCRKGSPLLDAPAAAPAFKRMESSLLLAFRGMPKMETPAKGSDRVFQLRIYESPSVKTGRKKVEMFNDAGEIAIFRRVGLNPVFFGQSLVGGKMPNLTYMLGFANADQQQAAWTKFREDPEWLALRAKPEYGDKEILCGITNLLLKPAEYSQI
jgi:hypothetical protein